MSSIVVNPFLRLTVVAQGLGPIGMCAAKWAQLKGASRVIGIDKVPERLAFARDKLGIETIDFTEHTDVVKRFQELVPGGLDVAIDCGESKIPKTFLSRSIKAYRLIDFLLQEHSMNRRHCFIKFRRR